MATKPLPVHGVDISHHQSGVINYDAAVKAGVRFVYHKASEGATWTDSHYGVRRAQVAKVNARWLDRLLRRPALIWGAYHFARPSVGDAVAEANHFLTTAKPRAGDGLPVLDLEVNDSRLTRSQLTAWVAKFHSVVADRTGDKRMIVYTPFDLDSVPSGVRLWVARYSNDNAPPNVPAPWRRYHIRQFSEGIHGVPNEVAGFGHVDLDALHPLTLARAKATRWANLRLKRRVKEQPENPVPHLGELAIRRFQPGTNVEVGMCLMEVREAYGIAARFPSAASAWANAKERHPETNPKHIPRGYPVFWTGGSQGFGHIAISLGDGTVLSTDILRRGRVDRVPIDLIRQRWGMRLVGWTSDLNGVKIR